MFCWCHFLWNTSLYFVSQPLCSFKSVSLSSLNSSDYIARASLTVAGSTVPPSAISSINAFPFDSNVAGSVIFYFSAALWSLSDNSSFPLFIFIKWHISLSLGKKAVQLQSLLFVCKLNNRCTVSNHQNLMRLVTDHDVQLLFTQ